MVMIFFRLSHREILSDAVSPLKLLIEKQYNTSLQTSLSLTNDNKRISIQEYSCKMIAFKTFICSRIGISDEMWRLLEENIETVHFKKGDRIMFKDDIWTDIMYINSGLIRSYIINDKGKDFTRQFYFNTSESRTANLFVLDLTSMLTQTPSNRGFEVLAESEVLRFSREKLFSLYEKYKTWEHIGRLMAEFAYIDMDTFYYALLTKTPKERYLELQTSMSGLMSQVKQYHIASYLGITPVTLSRIKRELKNH